MPDNRVPMSLEIVGTWIWGSYEQWNLGIRNVKKSSSVFQLVSQTYRLHCLGPYLCLKRKQKPSLFTLSDSNSHHYHLNSFLWWETKAFIFLNQILSTKMRDIASLERFSSLVSTHSLDRKCTNSTDKNAIRSPTLTLLDKDLFHFSCNSYALS